MFESFFNALNQLYPFEWVLPGIWFVSFLLKTGFLIFFYGRTIFKKEKAPENSASVSFILTFRNEEQNLRNNLPAILTSKTSNFEVVAVDDFSQDNSLAELGVLKQKYKNLRISALNQETRFSEKMAQNIALKAAKHEWVMVIPPSISGISPQWPAHISSRLNNGSEVVLYYSTLESQDGLFNLLYRAECFFQQLKSFGYILNGLPFLYFEENVAFRKENYFRKGGFGKKVKEPYANMELVINSFIKKNSADIYFSSDTTLRKKIPVNLSNFLELVKKEARIRKHLPFLPRFFLAFEQMISLFFFPYTVVLLLIFMELWVIFIVLIIVYIGSFSFIIKISLNRLNERNLFLPSLLVGLLMPYFKTLCQIYWNFCYRKQKWKSKK